ncbi:hypothetical protein MSG28_009323 [Choristoneura fumiferana]|uniref:Uncharacterized protein n=1 Tax=Choristoneura fumiferana TaxID=7141 RepID=A0ACC0KWW0_CHOFU|nr:hypothetical protein MSG28_009323 [Choristoneura fumiferana]
MYVRRDNPKQYNIMVAHYQDVQNTARAVMWQTMLPRRQKINYQNPAMIEKHETTNDRAFSTFSIGITTQ